jgi:CubicO group peptidase (beta-lactamase class C family)
MVHIAQNFLPQFSGYGLYFTANGMAFFGVSYFQRNPQKGLKDGLLEQDLEFGRTFMVGGIHAQALNNFMYGKLW